MRHLLSVALLSASLAVGCNAGISGDDASSLESSAAELTITAGAQALPDTAFAQLAPAKLFHVAKTGNDANPGTASAPWATVEKAVRTLLPGQGVYVHAGTYSEHLDLSVARDGTATAPIFFMGAPGETRPVLLGQRDNSMVTAQRSYWVFQHLDINANGHRSLGFGITNSNHVAVRDCLIHNGQGPAAISIAYGAKDVLIQKNVIHDYKWYVNGLRQDSHGVDVNPDSERVLVQQNEIYATSGDAVQCKGVAEAFFGTMDPRDITLEDNRLHHTAENAVDIKSCQRVTVRGGPADSSKFYGFRPADDTGTNCAGAAIVLHYGARQILIERNRFWDAGLGITIGRSETLAHDIIIRRNLFFNLTTDLNGCGIAVRVNHSQNVEVSNNTFDNIPHAAIQVGVDTDPGLPADYTALRNNLIRNAGYMLDVRATGAPHFASDRNLFWLSSGAAPPFRLNELATSRASFASALKTDVTSITADPRFVPDPASNDYYTQAGSPARDAALNATGTYCGAAPDIGALESCM